MLIIIIKVELKFSLVNLDWLVFVLNTDVTLIFPTVTSQNRCCKKGV